MEHLHRAARHIADQGRGPDSHLMHVSTNELKALGRLHPSGNVPRNPRTGLPEAGFLDQILPMVVGLGATLATGGAAAPLVGAAASGLTKTAMTGDIGQGLMTGLLSYGAGTALNGLASGAGEAASGLGDAAGGLGDVGGGLGGTLGQTASLPGATAGLGATGSLGGAAEAASSGFGGVTGLPAAAAPASGQYASLVNSYGGGSAMPGFEVAGNLSAPTTGNLGGELATPTLGSTVTAPTVPSASGVSDMSFMDKLSAAKTNLQSDPEGTLSRTFIDNAKTTTLPIGLGLAGGAMDTPYEAPHEPTGEELRRRYPEQFPDPIRTAYQGPSPGDTGSDEYDYYPNMSAGGGVYGYYAKGGIADANPQISAKANIEAEAKMALIDHHPNAKQALRRYASVFGEEALKKLTDRVSSMGGRIRGAGGGLDDLIPGTIEGRKEVRLADGEFVVPADVVSHLGDGSSDHGVRKLTEMMNRIRKDKTGTEKQAGHIKDHKVLPA
jgi:hypothetical protein